MIRIRRGLLLIVWGLLSGTPLAAMADPATNAIEKIQIKNDPDAVLVRVDLNQELTSKPGAWSVVEPPRIVLDFPATENRTGKTSVPVDGADLKSYNLIQTDQVTRLVLNLHHPAQYSLDNQGKTLHIRLAKRPNSDAATTSASTKPSVMESQRPQTSILDDRIPVVRDIVFRRGDEGQAVITIDLSDGTSPVDVRRDGDVLKVEMRATELPEKLRVRRDVNDFATPVKSLTSTSSGNVTRLDIAARGAWFHQSSMTGNQLTLEVKPIPQSDQNKLIQTGQHGQKVSINFFDAEATMILRTLAEISGKNVMIDPSLAGRKVTVTLDNIAYDRALDIVMAQVNAGMRVQSDVILFGDRATLQKRDQESADEAARANETAPLVSETFTLNYIKPTDMVSLIRANIASQTGAGASAAASPGGAPSGAANSTSTSSGGMLSARGSMSPHDLTMKLFVRDTAAVIDSIRQIIQTVDVQQKQVMIEARIVSASTGTSAYLGFRLNMFLTDLAVVGGWKGGFGTNLTPTYGNVNAYGQALVPSLVTYNPQLSSGISLPGAANMGLVLLNSSGTKLINLEISANEKDNKAKALSAPRVVTESGKEATISTTTTQTYLSGVNNGTATYAQCVGPISLKVTPTITKGNDIQMSLDIQRGNARIVTIGAAQGCESTVDAIKTNLTIEDGGTVVIGGVILEDESKSEDRLPFFGDLPYVGFLFKSTSKLVARKELLIFLTPKIVKGADPSAT